MTVLPRRERNRQERHQRILEAAIHVFSSSGFSGASMDAIAARSGLSKPTLYQYFGSKDELFRAMMAAPQEAMLQTFELPGRGDFVDRLHAFAWVYADTVMRPEYLSLARLVIGEAHRFPDIGRDYQQSGPDKVLAGVMAFFDAHRRDGRLAFEDAELAAEDFWGLILSAPRNRALHVPDETMTRADLGRYIDNGLRTFLRAYSTGPASDIARLAGLSPPDPAP